MIYLRDLIKDRLDSAFGNAEGRRVFNLLASAVDKFPTVPVLGISLKGIKRIDASFPRESIVAYAMTKRDKAFYLCDFESQDVMDNCDYAAKAKLFNLVVQLPNGYTVIGPELRDGSKELLDYVYAQGEVTTAKVVQAFDISTPNASAKLKKLLNQNLVYGFKNSAASGGLEYVFRAIK